MSEHIPPDFLLITPLEEEREAVLHRLQAVRRLPPDERDVRIYYAAELPVHLSDGTPGNYRLILTSPLGMGRVEATAATSDAIHRFQPRYVLLIGIAGGTGDTVSLGDVLVADQFIDYELQKKTDHGSQIRYQAYRADPRLLIAAQHLRDWQQTVLTTRLDTGLPRRHIGPIASGDKVIATRDGIQAYLNDWPKLIGLEMEAGGVASAAFQAANKPGVLMIRGVSDLADLNKNSIEVTQWRQYACEVAAAYTLALLRSGPVPFRDQTELQRKATLSHLAEQLKITTSACQLILKKPYNWEFQLFGQVLSDEFKKLAGLDRDYQLGISQGPRVYIEQNDLVQEARLACTEVVEMMKGLDSLINGAFVEAFGPPGTDGNPEAIVYVAHKIASFYQQALQMLEKWNRYDAEEEIKNLLAISKKIPVPIVEVIQDFNKKYGEELSRVLATEGTDEKVVFRVKVTVDPHGKLAKLATEAENEARRIKLRRSLKFW